MKTLIHIIIAILYISQMFRYYIFGGISAYELAFSSFVFLIYHLIFGHLKICRKNPDEHIKKSD